MILKTATWMKESHGLFDYESRQIIKKTIKTHCDRLVIRSGNEISVIMESELPEMQSKGPCEILSRVRVSNLEGKKKKILE